MNSRRIRPADQRSLLLFLYVYFVTKLQFVEIVVGFEHV